MKDFNREEIEKKMLNYIPDEGIRRVLLDNYSTYRPEGFYFGVCDRLFELRPTFHFDDFKEMYSYIRNFYPDVSVIYVTPEASEVVAAVVDEPYEPEYLDYNIIFGVIFGFYLIVRLMSFVRKALFVRFDGNKEA